MALTFIKSFRNYLSLLLLFVPPAVFVLLIIIYRANPRLNISHGFPYLPWQFILIGLFGGIATAGGVLDWKYHRNPLNMKIPKKEREAEAAALGLGGLPMFCLMWLAMMSTTPTGFLIPVLLVLTYTTTAICYDEFVFHIKRCTALENRYHRMLVFGNGIAWLSWFHFIYCR